jgi:hypothetical protein
MAYALAGGTGAARDGPFFLYTIWNGGQPLGSFLRGTTAWADLMAATSRVRASLAGRRLAGRVAALVFVQGESGPPGREAYAATLRALIDDALPALATQAQQDRPPLAILVQTNASNAQPASARGVALAQWDVARSRPGDTVLAGPMYQFPLGDAVHQSAEGRMMLGDLLALVYDARIVRGEAYEPLHPVSARRVGASIRVAFKRPAGALPLQWDRTWVPTVPNYGFVFEDEQHSAVIDKVEITGPSEVTLHLDRAPSGKRMVVRYAMGQPPLPGWASGRGQLMAPTARRSAFTGYRVPQTISHYAIRFETVPD